MQAAGFSRELERAAAAPGLDLGEDGFVFFSGESEGAAFLDAPCAAAASGDGLAAAAATFVSSHFGLPDPATTGVFLASKAITLDGRSWRFVEDYIGPEEETLERDPSDDGDNELEPEDLEEFLISAFSEPEPDKKKPETENATGACFDQGLVSAKPGLDKEKHGQRHSQSHSQGIVIKEKGAAAAAAASQPKLSSDASVLRELQTIVSKLDARSRFCLRDAFYRLADNVTRRPGAHADAADLQRLTSSTASWRPRPEVSTNSIDRSVASLLFRKESPPPPLPLPPLSPPSRPPRRRARPPKSLFVATAITASSSSTFPKKQQQQQLNRHQTLFNGNMSSNGNINNMGNNNTGKKIPLPPAHKHPCAGSSSVRRTATTLRATPAAIPAAVASMPLPREAGITMALKRRTPMGNATTTSSAFHKRGKHSLV